MGRDVAVEAVASLETSEPDFSAVAAAVVSVAAVAAFAPVAAFAFVAAVAYPETLGVP